MAQVNYGGIKGLGVSVKFTGFGATLSLLGNMMSYYPGYVDAIREEAPGVVNKVAVRYFNRLSKSKSKDSPFMKTSYIIGSPRGSQTIDLILDMWSDPRILWYIEGTKSYDIYPTNKKFLMFYWQKYNKIVFAKHVRHPGISKHESVITDIRKLSYRPLMAMIMANRRLFEVGSGKRMSFDARVANFGYLNTVLGRTPFDSGKAMSGRSFLSDVFSGKIRGINYA